MVRWGGVVWDRVELGRSSWVALGWKWTGVEQSWVLWDPVTTLPRTHCHPHQELWLCAMPSDIFTHTH